MSNSVNKKNYYEKNMKTNIQVINDDTAFQKSRDAELAKNI